MATKFVVFFLPHDKKVYLSSQPPSTEPQSRISINYVLILSVSYIIDDVIRFQKPPK